MKLGPNMRGLIIAQSARMQDANIDDANFWCQAAISAARAGALAQATDEEIAFHLLAKMAQQTATGTP